MTLCTLVALSLCAAQGPADLAADTRLGRAVEVRAEAETVGSLLARLSRQLNVRLAAASAVEQDLVILYAKDRPAHEILSIIADHFDWTWKKEEGGYRLYQTADQKKEEQRLLEEAILEPYLTAQKAAGEFPREAAKVDRKEAKKRIAEITLEIEKLGFAEVTPAYLALLRERGYLRSRTDPYRIFAETVFASFTRSQLLELDARTKIVVSTRPTSWQQPIGRNGGRAAETLVAELVRMQQEYFRDRKPPPPEGRTGSQLPEGIRAAFTLDDVAAVHVVFDADPRLRYDFAGSPLWVSVTVLGHDGAELAWTVRIVGARSRRTHSSEESSGEPGGPRPPVQERGGRLADRLTITNELATALGFLDPDDSALDSFISGVWLKPGSTTDFLAPIAKIYLELASAAGFSVIADAYDSHLVDAAGAGGLGRTAALILDALTRPIGATWAFDDPWVKVRTRKWPLARASTLPRKIARPARDTAVRQMGFTLDQAAALATALTDRQIASPILSDALGDLVFPKPYESEVAALHAYRMWDALSAYHRETLLRGEPLPLAAIAPAARRHLAEYLYVCEYPGIYKSATKTNEEEDIELWDGLWAESNDHDWSEDTEITQLLPFGPPPEATIHLRYWERPGVAAILRPLDRPRPVILGTTWFAHFKAMSESAEMGDILRLDVNKVKLALVQNYHFTFRFRPGLARTFIAVAATSDPSVAFGPMSALPPALLRKIKEAEEPPPGD
ncbi:MAG: hypothetical protein IH851_02225 [Armatimonadetes bacterium]|nr:hypothetical protein [Armatimonadota bacterium]